MPEYNEENTRGGKAGVAARKLVNSPTYRGLSNALVGSAFESFGKAFDGGGYTPRGMRPDTSYLNNWREMGAKTQQALENRWHTAEFANFRKTYLNKFQEDMQSLLEESQYLTKEFREGRWTQPDGTFQELDLNNEADRMKALRIKGQIEQETGMKMMEMQINLNNTAAEKYASNPIVDGMIQSMMTKQMQMLSGQFQQPGSMQQAKGEQELRGGEADIKYKQALTRQADATTTQGGGKYKSTDAVMRDMGPAQAARYFTSNVEGKALLEGTTYPTYVGQLEIKARKYFIKDQKWTAEEAGLQPNQAAIQAYIDENRPRLENRALGEWIKAEYGDDAYQTAGTSRPGLFEDEPLPFEYDVETMPSKDEVESKKKKWDALGVEKANEELRRDPSMTPKEAVNWLMEEWFPEAIGGTDIATGAYLAQFDGLTADQANKAAKPYIKAVRDSLRKAAERFVGTGPGTEQLLSKQRPAGRRPSRRGGLGRASAVLLDKITPDVLLPDVGKGLYPPDFRKEFPDERENKK